MERKHKEVIKRTFDNIPEIKILEIPDLNQYMDSELIEVLEEKLDRWIK